MEKFSAISAKSLGRFEAYAKWESNYVRSGADLTFLETQAKAVRKTLSLNDEDIEILNDVWRTYHVGIPSSNHLVNIIVAGLSLDLLTEVMLRYENILTQEEIVEAFELGVDIQEEMVLIQTARRLVDTHIAMYCAEVLAKEEYSEDLENRCIAFPGMPNLHPLLQTAFEYTEKYLREENGSMVGSMITRFNDAPIIVRYPATMAEDGGVVVRTGAGSIYLLGKPSRTNTAANHLRAVRNDNE